MDPMIKIKPVVKLESSIDFLSSYAIAIIALIFILSAVFLIIKIQPTYSCTSPPNFNCGYVSMSTNGFLLIKVSQAIGEPILINGAACADQQNTTINAPKYGNVAVGRSNFFYPIQLETSGDYPPGNHINSDQSYVFYVNCYQVGGSLATGKLGSTFSGYLWLNYTIPSYGPQIQEIATFTTTYT